MYVGKHDCIQVQFNAELQKHFSFNVKRRTIFREYFLEFSRGSIESGQVEGSITSTLDMGHDPTSHRNKHCSNS